MSLASRAACLVVVVGALARLAGTQEAPPGPPPARPKVALVLSGGGARGAAHVGVLKVLEELRVPVDMVVGTSVGSIIGGLYAAGWSPDEIERLVTTIDWEMIFSDRVERDNSSFRRKQDDEPFLIQTRLRFRDWKPYLPTGVLGGQRLDLFLRTAELSSTRETDFDRFPIPFRAVACDLVTGELVVIDHGSLATAMRASMSLPGVFPPVELEGRSLIDGGAVANLPVGVAQALGADRVVAVDISSPLSDKEASSVWAVYGQLTNFLLVANREADVRRLKDGDVLVVPEMGEMTFADFPRIAEAVALGERAARARTAELERLSLPEEEYAAFRARHRREVREAPVVDELVLENTSPVADELVRRQLHVEIGQPVDFERLGNDLLSLYNLEYFGPIRDRLERDGESNRLVVETTKPRFGRSSLQFGLSFYNDFKGDTQHGLALRHRVLAVNRRGGEWQNLIQVGDAMLAASELYQPLDYGMAWFVEPRLEVRRTALPLWADGEQVAEYRVGRTSGRLDLGRVLGNWGEVRLGAVASSNRGETRIGSPVQPDLRDNLSGAEVGFRVDTLDSVAFPRRGLRVEARYGQGLTAMGSDHSYRQAFLAVDGAMAMGKLTLAPGLEVASNLDDDPSFFNLVSLGGFTRLSGLGDRELRGRSSFLARVVVYEQLARLVIASAKVKAYAGLSLEAGNVFQQKEPTDWNALRACGSVFVGLDTSVGPVYLAWGYADGGEKRLVFRFGQSF